MFPDNIVARRIVDHEPQFRHVTNAIQVLRTLEVGIQIEVLIGPAGTGKSSQLVDLYRTKLQEAQQQQRLNRTIWLAPHFRVCEWVLRELPSRALPVVVAPNVFTFDDFADRILQFSPEIMRPLSPLMKRVLVRRVIVEKLAQNKLPHYGKIAGTSGFIDVVLQLISELKREEAWPEDFEAAISKRGAKAADLELSSLYQAYQNLLVSNQRYDGEGRFWSARDQLTQGNWGPFDNTVFDLVVVDGFTDFTHTQYEILGLLSQHANQMVVSLPGEENSLRPDLFSKSTEALQRLQRFAKCVPSYVQLNNTLQADHIPGLRTISENLFRNPREVVQSDQTGGIEILETTGQVGEVRAIAERIKILLLNQVAPDDIVLGFRSIAEYAPLVHEIFTAAGIPFHVESPPPLNQHPGIRTLLSILRLEEEDWSFERLMGLLHSRWFRPKWSDWNERETPRVISQTLRHLKVPNGRAAILSALERAMRSHDLDPKDSSPANDHGEMNSPKAINTATQRDGLQRAFLCLSHLSDALLPLRQPLTARDWAEQLARLARELGLDEFAFGSTSGESQIVWKMLKELLFLAAGTEELVSLESRRLNLAQFLTEFQDLVQHQSMTGNPRIPGVVQVIDAAQVRGLDVPFLFIGGLTESSFPKHSGDSFLYSEADRRELNEHGLTLGHRNTQSQAEMLLFYGVVTRAKKQLFLSYPAVSFDGQPLSPSPYLTTLCELFVPESLNTTRIEVLNPVPPEDCLLTRADLRIAAMSTALDRRPGLLRALASQADWGWANARSMLAAAEMNQFRFHTRGFTQFEGILSDQKNLDFLAEHFSTRTEFSATQLEGYAQCPFQFWMSDVLKIRPAEAPDEFTDHGRRGSMVHDILVELHSQIEVEDDDEVPIDRVIELFHLLIDQRLSIPPHSSDLQAALFLIEQRLLKEWGREYAQQWQNYTTTSRELLKVTMRPTHFEVSFGRPHQEASEPQKNACFILGSGIHETRIRGRIDRIDVGHYAQQTVFSIIDYKTGKKTAASPAKMIAEIQSGRSLQLILYALAVKHLNLVGPHSVPIQQGYWFLKSTGFHPILKPPETGPNGMELSEEWLALETGMWGLVPRLANGIRTGKFPVYNTDPNCVTFCPYRTVCRVSQIRPVEEALDKLWPAGNFASTHQPGQ